MIREALGIVDTDGVAALSMRRLGQACGVEAMSLYHHVSGKADVLDGVRDLVLAEIASHLPRDVSAREQLEGCAKATWGALLRHPNIVPVLMESRSFSEPAMRISESVLTAFRNEGYTPEQAFAAAEVVNAYVLGSVAVAIAVRERGDMSQDAATAPAFDPAAYPSVMWAYDALHAAKADPYLMAAVIFGDGLTALLDGLNQQFATSSTS